MEEKKTQNCPLCGTLCEVIHEHIEGEKPVDEIWESFWKPIVSNEDGTINIEQVKKELADFSFVMEQVPKVYCHITGDTLSKVMYRAEDVIRMADDHFNEQLREAVKEEREGESNPVWVKASERYPEKDDKYFIRQNGAKSAANLWQYTKEYWQTTEMEWLDESGAALLSDVEFGVEKWEGWYAWFRIGVQKFRLQDAESKESAEWYMKMLQIAFKKLTGAAPSGEREVIDPIEFHNWLYKEHWEQHSSGRYWHRSKDRHQWPPEETCEEKDLIQKFKQQNEK